jgi:hypothetical protein
VSVASQHGKDEETWTSATTARQAFVATLVAIVVIVVALALWELKVVLALILPIAAVVATVVDVSLRGVDPGEVDVPTVIFSPQDAG